MHKAVSLPRCGKVGVFDYRPLQTWKTFLRNHMEGITSIDLFVVPTITFQQLFAFLVLDHERRRLLWFAVTRNPTAAPERCPFRSSIKDHLARLCRTWMRSAKVSRKATAE
jgi:hypothetical protein